MSKTAVELLDNIGHVSAGEKENIINEIEKNRSAEA